MICFKCGGEFRQVYRSGKIRDIDSMTNREHWRDCAGRGPNRQRVQQLRKRRKSGRGSSATGSRSGGLLERVNVEPKGSVDLCERAFRDHHASNEITGRDYRPSCATCTALPWDQCPCFPSMPVSESINRDADERLQLALFEEVAA